MPQNAPVLPLLTALNQRVAKALASLRKEIAQREAELVRLKAEAERWKSLTREPARGIRVPAVPSRVPAVTGTRLDWSALLKELPARFTSKEVAQKAGKPLQQVYIGVVRWIKDKKIRKVKDGYQKVSAR